MAYSKVKSIEEDGNEDVYCLTVPEVGNFVANGIVIKNCDAARYALYTHWGGRDKIKETSREESYAKSQQSQWQQNPMAYPGFTNSYGWQRY